MSREKERYYSDADVVREYERRRFERGGGRYVAETEAAAIGELIDQMHLAPGDLALDCPTGTGRFLPLLQSRRLRTIAVDISPGMLEFAGRQPGTTCIRASADALPLAPRCVKIWLMSRFAFHFADLRAFFRQAARVLSDDGALLFDIYHWTPRAWIPGKQTFLGGRVHTHRQALVEEWLRESGLVIAEARPTFFLAPYLYGFMPAFFPRWLDHVSDRTAPRWKTKSYLLVRRVR